MTRRLKVNKMENLKLTNIEFFRVLEFNCDHIKLFIFQNKIHRVGYKI